jgi:hypothetical protein
LGILCDDPSDDDHPDELVMLFGATTLKTPR